MGDHFVEQPIYTFPARIHPRVDSVEFTEASVKFTKARSHSYHSLVEAG
jgi:hypothetical protein